MRYKQGKIVNIASQLNGIKRAMVTQATHVERAIACHRGREAVTGTHTILCDKATCKQTRWVQKMQYCCHEPQGASAYAVNLWFSVSSMRSKAWLATRVSLRLARLPRTGHVRQTRKYHAWKINFFRTIFHLFGKFSKSGGRFMSSLGRLVGTCPTAILLIGRASHINMNFPRHLCSFTYLWTYSASVFVSREPRGESGHGLCCGLRSAAQVSI